MRLIDFIGLGAIVGFFVLSLCLASYQQRKRRQQMNLRRLTPPLEDLNQPTQADEDWRNAAPSWSDPRYFGGSRRRP